MIFHNSISKYKKKYLRKIFTIIIAIVTFCLVYVAFNAIYVPYGMTEFIKKGGVTVYISSQYTESEKDTVSAFFNQCFDELDGYNMLDGCDLDIYLCHGSTEFKIKNRFRYHKEIDYNPNIMVWDTVFLESDAKKNVDENIVSIKLIEMFKSQIAYSYIKEKLGVWEWLRQMYNMNWKIGGFSNYVAEFSSANIVVAQNIFLAQKNIDRNINVERGLWKRCFNRYVGRLRTDYLLRHKGVPENEYWDTNYDTDKLDDEIREALQSGEYRAFEQ